MQPDDDDDQIQDDYIEIQATNNTGQIYIKSQIAN